MEKVRALMPMLIVGAIIVFLFQAKEPGKTIRNIAIVGAVVFFFFVVLQVLRRIPVRG